MRKRIFLYCTMGPWMLTTGEPMFIQPVSTPVQPGWCTCRRWMENIKALIKHDVLT